MLKKKNFFTFVLLASVLFLVYSSNVMAAADEMTGPSWAGFGAIDPEDIPDDVDEIGFTWFEPKQPCNSESIGWCWFNEMASNAINYFFLIGIILAPLIILLGAFMFFTSAGDASRVGKGKALITWASIGLVILLSARLIMAILKAVLDF